MRRKKDKLRDNINMNNNSNSSPSSPTTSNNAPSEILHRIASYLSINDAESMSVGGSYYSSTTQTRTAQSSTQFSVRSSQHSLDYVYQSSNRSRVSPLAANTPRHNHPTNNNNNTMNNREHLEDSSPYNNNNQDEEDWFVGGQHSINSQSLSGTTSLSLGGGVSATPHPGFVTLMPLEEEFDNSNNYVVAEKNVVQGNNNNNAGGANNLSNNPATAALERAEEEEDGEEIEISPWTPAGQGTSESEDTSLSQTNNNSNSMGEIHMISNHDVHSEITNHHESERSNSSRSPSPSFFQQRKRQRQQKQALQNKLAAAVFSHPHPLRQYCLDAYSTALSLSMERQKQRGLEGGESRSIVTSSSDVLFKRQENAIEIRGKMHFSQRDIVHFIMNKLLQNIPLSVLLDLVESTCDLSIETILATTKIGTFTINKCVNILCDTAWVIIDVLSRINPFHVFEFVVNAQRSAMGKTGDVLVSGIQSVATGVGSVSNAALNRLSRSGLALAGGVVGGSRSGEPNGFGRMRKDSSVNHENVLESKLFHRLQKMESVSKLVAYSERRGEEAFSRHAKKRAQRMMHYNVSFRPFTATIQSKDITSPNKRSNRKMKHNVSFEFDPERRGYREVDDDDSDGTESINSSGSIFMRTPTSFPPTPRSRLYYFERGSQFTENVVFLARDQLRIERGVVNHNEQTRAMSKALIDGSRLAVFDAANVGTDIALTCGQHIATKVGNSLYCSCRSMIPVMRNSYVYFEISVSPATAATGGPTVPQVDATTLLVGLSTLEMPLDTLVGAWNGSVGLCSTGQILQSGQWFSLSNPEESSYGSNSTVGCLVYLDDNSAYDNAEGGPHVSMDVTFNINGRIIPSSSASIFSGATASSSNGTDTNNPDSSSGRSAVGCEPTLSLIVPKAHELFPTVTLHSAGTSVMCRFSAEDLLANSRAEIGALSGATVYAVDGSVILDESEEDEYLDSSSQCNDFFNCQVAL